MRTGAPIARHETSMSIIRRIIAPTCLAIGIGVAGCESAAPAPSGGVTVTTPLADVTVDEGRTAVFQIAVETALPFVVEWRRDGVVVDARGSSSFTIPATTGADHNAVFTARVVAGTLNQTTVEAGSARLRVTLRPPLAPTSLTATLFGLVSVEFRWQDNSADETGFVVTGTEGLDEEELAELRANETVLFYTGFPNATTQTYRVRAIRAIGGQRATSDASSLTVTFPPHAGSPLAPTNARLSSVANLAGAMDFTWDDNASNEDGYHLFQFVNGRDVQIGQLPAGATQFRFTGRTPGETYTFRVCAFRSDAGLALRSAMATATLTLPF
jgi:hypothetical protein